MVVVSSREFRSNQRKYFDLARTNDVVITSRNHGNYRLIPILDDDKILSELELAEKIRKGIEEYSNGTVHAMRAGESAVDFVNRLVSED